MIRERRLRHYQRFLKSLKKPEPTRCSCTAHLHPRPWVPPPCRTTRPHQEETPLRSRRTLSNPELMTNTGKLYETGPRQDWESDEDSRPGHKHLRNLYKEARILKEALNNVRHGNELSRDTRSIVKKWIRKGDSDIPPKMESHTSGKGQRPHAESHTDRMEALNRSMSEAQQEEEALRQELQNLRKMAKSSSAMEEENKKLKRKIHQLQRRLKRQEKVPRASHESLGADREMGSRDEFLILSLKKKYEDLLQYVLKVEAENQKLKSLTGLSGDGEGLLRDSDREDAQYGPHVVTRLHHELEALRQELSRKDGLMVEYDQRLQAMEALKEENLSLHKTLRDVYSTNFKPSDERPLPAAVEEEWMARLAETREMYEQVVEGYKEKFEEMRENMIRSEEAHARRTRELEDEVHSLRRSAIVDDKMGRQDSRSKSPEVVESSGSKRNKESEATEGREKTEIRGEIKEGSEYRSEGLIGTIGRENLSSTDDGDAAASRRGARPRNYDRSRSSKPSKIQHSQRGNRKGKRPSHEKSSRSEETSDSDDVRESRKKLPEEQESDGKKDKNCHICTANDKLTDTQKYVDTLNSLVERMEKISVGGDGAEATMSVIREAINTCLKEWKDSFQEQQPPPVQEKESLGLRKEYDELQRKMRSKQRKMDSQQKQIKDLESQNAKLMQKCSQLESQIAGLQSSDKFGLLQDLPQVLHDTEQKLAEAQATLKSAETERHLLQDQVLQLGEKLNKKESKLKNERDQNMQREKGMDELKEEVGLAKRRAEEMSREVSHLQDQLGTKDALLERTSAQLEERIRECAALSSQIERLRQERSQDWEKIQSQMSERDSATSKQYIEAQAQVARYQAQLSAMRSEKEQAEKSLRQHVRKLEDQLDSLQLRNSTMQRQLATITSTYHNMFSNIDIHSPSSPGFDGTSGMKDP